MTTGPPGPNAAESPHSPRGLGPLRGTVVHVERTLGAGILVLLPIGVTVLVLKFFFDLLDPLLQEPALSRLPGPDIPGLGLLALLILVYLAGLVTTQVLGRAIVDLGHRILEYIPVVNSIYSTTRSAVQLLSNSDKQPYRGVVLVEFPHPGMQSFGFITSRIQDENGENKLAVYIPTTPIPSSGFLVIVREEDAIPTDLSVEDAMKVVVTGGLLAEREIQQLPVADRSKSSSNQ